MTKTKWCVGGAVVVIGLAAVSPAGAQQQHDEHRAAEHGRHMEHRFDDAEQYAEVFDDPARDAWQLPDRVIEALAIRPGEKVADIGAGTGYFTVRLARDSAADTVYAVDIEPSMVDYVRNRATREGLDNVVAVLADGEATNLPEPVDVVLIVNTFHHIPGRVAYFTALRDLMNPGARLAIVDYKKGAPGGPPDEFRFTPDEITDELGRAGFELRSPHDLPRQSFLIYGAQSTEPPRTEWGDPDLGGVWDYWTFTPLQRSEELGDKATFTDEEAATLAQEANAEALARDLAAPPGDPGGYSQAVWTDRARATALTQTSLIIDPPDGRIPQLTPEALAREEARLAGDGQPVRIRVGGFGTAGPEERGLAERCLLGFSTGPPLLPGGYNNNVQIFQTPEAVVLLIEMNHDVRVVPIDGRPELSDDVRQWMGSSRGRWDGDSLVIDTRNFTDRTASFGITGLSLGSAAALHLEERFTRVDDDTLVYEFTVNDPASFTRPFSGRLPMNASDLPLYEYACHEGNYGMENLLRGARTEEREAAGP